MHVAIGPEVEGESARVVALVPAITMAGWMGRLQSHGLDPDLVLPEPLLLPRPEHGVIRYDRGPLPLFRGRNDAFSVEPELAEIIVPGSDFTSFSDEDFEHHVPDAIANPAINLRQGPFAKRRRWKLDWKQIRRLAALTAGILLLTLAIQIANILRYTYAADELEAEANRIAAQALPTVSVSNAPAQLERRVAELGGNSGGYGGIASAVFAAVRDTPNAALAGMTFDSSGTVRATIEADFPVTITAFQNRLESSGFTVLPGPMRSAGGRAIAELTVQAR